jgi:hypothetical protein
VKIRKQTRCIILCIWTVLLLTQSIAYAQSDEASALIVVQFGNPPTLQQITFAGELQLLAPLPEELILPGSLQGNLRTYVDESIAVSPDGQYIAISAQNYDTNKTPLLIYNQSGTLQTELDLPGTGMIRWSPTSTALVIVPDELVGGPALDDTYLYDLEQDTLTQLTDTEGRESPFAVWWPDGSRLVIAARTELNNQLELIELPALTRTVVTQFTAAEFNQDLAYPVSDRVCKPGDLWAFASERLYYLIDCTGTGNATVAYSVYSVGIAGDHRFEFDNNAHYVVPTGTTPLILSINGAPDGNVYITSFGPVRVNGELGPILRSLDVFAVVQPGAVNTTYERMFAETERVGTLSVSMSPNGETLAISGGFASPSPRPVLWLINLTTCTLQSENDLPAWACVTHWLDSENLYYSDISIGQDCSEIPDSHWLLNVNTGATTQIAPGAEFRLMPPFQFTLPVLTLGLTR